jgi:hypothetical protein
MEYPVYFLAGSAFAAAAGAAPAAGAGSRCSRRCFFFFSSVCYVADNSLRIHENLAFRWQLNIAHVN